MSKYDNTIDRIRAYLDGDEYMAERFDLRANAWGFYWDMPLGDDWQFVTRRLATGAGIYSPQDVRDLQAKGVTHILDCRIEARISDRMAEEFPEVGYFNNGCDDDGKPKSVEYFRRSIEYGLWVLSQPNTVLYVHCAAGINRGPSSAYAILRAQGLSPNQAWNLLKSTRPIVRCLYSSDADVAVKALGYDPGIRKKQ